MSVTSPYNLDTRRKTAMLGLLIGDAWGVPYEFHGPGELPDEITMPPPAGFDRAHPSAAPGAWSDDGALALALWDSLKTCGRLDPADARERFRAWFFDGKYTPDGNVFDVGNQTRIALESTPPAGEYTCGNGSLMRVLPVALLGDNDEQIIEDACVQSCITHPHPLAQACCAIYAYWVWLLLRDPSVMFATALGEFENATNGRFAEHLQKVRAHEKPEGTGYVVDSLVSAARAFDEASSFDDAIVRAIRFGHDTDTTAAIAGGLAGLRWGGPIERIGFLANHDPLFELGITARRTGGAMRPAEDAL